MNKGNKQLTVAVQYLQEFREHEDMTYIRASVKLIEHDIQLIL